MLKHGAFDEVQHAKMLKFLSMAILHSLRKENRSYMIKYLIRYGEEFRVESCTVFTRPMASLTQELCSPQESISSNKINV